ncbi:F-box domain, FBD domain, Leucine-rich repeat domain, L domain-like protein [Artemisia annua]|uniref:F-box domain, FBD domain, Leucine-rich repeat domain, L domain-like protein n=1 Tax=Artemisia annua TaxID=35608 RepID=A0A2U1NIY2_ARTAN|nr:F-box domain, FBD domain, Leucine-rich repeat domain, L domain-like protein [Artemisia annua]
MNKSKRAKPSNLENGVDFISNMPDPILQLILQGLPTTEEVVRTSVLSTRWRYLWTSIPYFPSLDIDCYRTAPTPSLMFPKKKFRDIVSWCLANKTVDLDSFRLCCASYYGKSTVHKWIEAAVNRNVKSLDLKFYPTPADDDFLDGLIAIEAIELPEFLITCESLESLRLFLYQRIIGLPRCTGFQALRVVELNNVYCFDHDLVEKFLNKCPLLEEFSLIDCFIRILDPVCVSSSKLKTLIIRNWKNVWSGLKLDFWCGLKVSCPQLVYFEYVGRRCEIILEDVRSLKKAVIHPEDLLQQRISPTLGKTVSMLLDGISHVESLSLNLYCIQCIDAAHNPDTDIPAFFPKLKTLEVTTTIDAFTMIVLIRILRFSPILESLNLIIKKEHLTTDYWVLDEVETRTILTRHLKSVKFLRTNGKKRRLVITRFLLEHGNALEEIVFSWSSKVKYHEKSLKIMKKLSKLQKASSTVKLISVLKE